MPAGPLDRLDLSPNRAVIEARIIELLSQEIRDPQVVLTRDTKRADVEIDSIDIANVMFALEDELGIAFDLRPNVLIETVGDLVDLFLAATKQDT